MVAMMEPAANARPRMFPADLIEQRQQLRTEGPRSPQQQWRRKLAGLPLSEQRARLRSPEAIAELGAKRIADILRGIENKHELLVNEVPSAAWLDNAYHGGAEFPLPGMVLSQAKVRFHPAGSAACVGHRRYYPPDSVNLEDYFDGMAFHEAVEYTVNSGYASPSALAIIRWKHIHKPIRNGPDIRENTPEN